MFDGCTRSVGVWAVAGCAKTAIARVEPTYRNGDPEIALAGRNVWRRVGARLQDVSSGRHFFFLRRAIVMPASAVRTNPEHRLASLTAAKPAVGEPLLP